MAISSTPTASEINVELGRAASDPFSIDGTEERALAQVPSGPITFADFIGKSAAPTYDDFNDFLDAGKIADRLGSDVVANMANNFNGFSKITSITASGTMWGSPFFDSREGVRSLWTSSVMNRVIQHMCQNETEFNNIVSNGWAVGLSRQGNFNAPQGWFAYTRNGYTTTAVSSATRLTTNRIGMWWWDGTQAWFRDHQAGRTPLVL